MDVILSLHAIDITQYGKHMHVTAAMIGVPDRVLFEVTTYSKTFWTPAIGEQLTARPGHVLINRY